MPVMTLTGLLALLGCTAYHVVALLYTVDHPIPGDPTDPAVKRARDRVFYQAWAWPVWLTAATIHHTRTILAARAARPPHPTYQPRHTTPRAQP